MERGLPRSGARGDGNEKSPLLCGVTAGELEFPLAAGVGLNGTEADWELLRVERRKLEVLCSGLESPLFLAGSWPYRTHTNEMVEQDTGRPNNNKKGLLLTEISLKEASLCRACIAATSAPTNPRRRRRDGVALKKLEPSNL